MPSMFDDLLDVADHAIDAMGSEPVVIRPQVRSPNSRALPDPHRPAVSTGGVFELRTGPAGIEFGNRETSRRGNDLRLLMNGPAPTLSVREADLQGVQVRQGDRVDLPDRGTGKRFEVVSVEPDGHGRVMLDLIQR